MSDQANILRGLMQRRHLQPVIESVAARPKPETQARTIAVTSGKGGVGKSNVALNVAIALSKMDAAVCLLDANLGLGNIDLLCGLNGYWNLSHVVTGARTLAEIMLEGPGGVRVIPGASGLGGLADCPPPARDEIFGQLDELERNFDFILIDTGAGIHRIVRQFVAASDLAMIVTTPEPTSIADAYATVKALATEDPPQLAALVNQAESPGQARAIVERLQQTARTFLKIEVASAGCVPADHHVPGAVCRRRPFLIDSPRCAASRAVVQVARRVQNLSAARPSRGPYFPRLRDFAGCSDRVTDGKITEVSGGRCR